MSPGLVTALITLIIVLAVLVFLLARTRANYASQASGAEQVPSPSEQAIDQHRLEAQEDELIERRIQLDARRGPLAGDADVLARLDELDARRTRGEITEQQYEAEKLRLLGG